MSILDIIPGIGEILDKTVTKKGDLEKIKVQLRELDVREIETRLGVQREWLSNKSVFVAGAIPTILWMVSIVVFFNCIVSPLLAPVWQMPVMELPNWYAELAGTVILGLFGKKLFDGNEIRWKGEVIKPAKGHEDAHDEASTQKAPVGQAPGGTQGAGAPASSKYATTEAVDARIDELARQYGDGK